MSIKWSQFPNGANVKIGDTIVGLRDGENYQFLFPSDGMQDQYGNYFLAYETTAVAGPNATNYVFLRAQTTGHPVQITGYGVDTNISIEVITKGSGNIYLSPGNHLIVGNSDPIVGFSNDPTLVDDSQYYCPTQYAVKTYVDSTAGGLVDSVTGTANRIHISGTDANPIVDIDTSYVGQSSISTLGTVTAGQWHGSAVGPTYGGTGVNNGSNTITLGGNLATTGAFNATFNFTSATNVTFPLTGALATTTGTVSNADNVGTNQVSNNASYYILMASSSTNSYQACDLSTALTYNPSTGIMSLTGLNVSGITASQVVATDASKNLVSVPYATAATADSLVLRDVSGGSTFGYCSSDIFQASSGVTASAGLVRCRVTDSVAWRNNGNTADITLVPDSIDILSLNNNFYAPNVAYGYTSVTTAAGSTTLTRSSTKIQDFTGTLIQDVFLADVTTLRQGLGYEILNHSVGAVTVKSSGGNILAILTNLQKLEATCILTTGTDTASWSWSVSTLGG